MDDPSPLLALALGAGVFVVRNLLASSKGENARLDRAWATAARQLGASARLEPGTFWRGAVRSIEGDVEGAPLRIDTFCEGQAGNHRTYYTRLTMLGLKGLCPADLRVGPRGTLSKLARRFAIGEEPTGDDAFDAAFRVTSSPAGLGRELLDAPTRRRLLALDEGFAIEGRTLTVRRAGLPSEAEPLVALGRFGEALARRWADAARAPARAAEALDLEPLEARADLTPGARTTIARGLRRGRELEVSALLSGPRPATQISCANPGGPSFVLARGPSGFEAEGDAPAYARAVVATAPPALARLAGQGGQVSLELDGLAHDANELARLVDAVLDATRSGGVYR